MSQSSFPKILIRYKGFGIRFSILSSTKLISISFVRQLNETKKLAAVGKKGSIVKGILVFVRHKIEKLRYTGKDYF